MPKHFLKFIQKKAKNQKGFGLLEITLGLVVVGIISLSFASLFGITIDQYSAITSRKEALSQARLAINRITEELLYIDSNALVSISSSNLSFIDTSGVATNFRTQTDAGILNLYRGNDLLAKNLSAFSLTYLDSLGAQIQDGNVSNVRRIQINLGVNASNNHGDVKLRGEVYPRNFYYSNFK
ncbi:MAG: type II secretion system protein [Deltaproteobacteria bacterium]|nr:type II secretion system protein [Deltaproteobacteria bacterium]